MLAETFIQTLVRGGTTIFFLALILIPVMVLVEYASHFRLLEKVSVYFSWLPRAFAMSPEAAFPLIVGMIIGVFYGAAVIIEYANQGILSKRDMMLCGVFLAINHSIFEDNLLFASMGANIVLIFPLRFLMAFFITQGFAAWLDRSEARKAAA